MNKQKWIIQLVIWNGKLKRKCLWLQNATEFHMMCRKKNISDEK